MSSKSTEWQHSGRGSCTPCRLLMNCFIIINVINVKATKSNVRKMTLLRTSQESNSRHKAAALRQKIQIRKQSGGSIDNGDSTYAPTNQLSGINDDGGQAITIQSMSVTFYPTTATYFPTMATYVPTTGTYIPTTGTLIPSKQPKPINEGRPNNQTEVEEPISLPFTPPSAPPSIAPPTPSPTPIPRPLPTPPVTPTVTIPTATTITYVPTLQPTLAQVETPPGYLPITAKPMVSGGSKWHNGWNQQHLIGSSSIGSSNGSNIGSSSSSGGISAYNMQLMGFAYSKSGKYSKSTAKSGKSISKSAKAKSTKGVLDDGWWMYNYDDDDTWLNIYDDDGTYTSNWPSPLSPQPQPKLTPTPTSDFPSASMTAAPQTNGGGSNIMTPAPIEQHPITLVPQHDTQSGWGGGIISTTQPSQSWGGGSTSMTLAPQSESPSSWGGVDTTMIPDESSQWGGGIASMKPPPQQEQQQQQHHIGKPSLGGGSSLMTPPSQSWGSGSIPMTPASQYGRPTDWGSGSIAMKPPLKQQHGQDQQAQPTDYGSSWYWDPTSSSGKPGGGTQNAWSSSASEELHAPNGGNQGNVKEGWNSGWGSGGEGEVVHPPDTGKDLNGAWGSGYSSGYTTTGGWNSGYPSEYNNDAQGGGWDYGFRPPKHNPDSFWGNPGWANNWGGGWGGGYGKPILGESQRPSPKQTLFPPTPAPSTAAPTASPTEGVTTYSPTNASSTALPTTYSPTVIMNPTVPPSSEGVPTTSPTTEAIPTASPTTEAMPTASPTSEGVPTFSPTLSPSEGVIPTLSPSTEVPTNAPTVNSTTSSGPSLAPSYTPSFSPVPSYAPSNPPSYYPSISPSNTTSYAPSNIPSNIPSYTPSNFPSIVPSNLPSNISSTTPSYTPSSSPSNFTETPSTQPTFGVFPGLITILYPEEDVDDNAFFGTSVAIDGDTIVVGIQDDGNGVGSAMVYKYDNVNRVFSVEAKLYPNDGQPADDFGRAVAISNDFIIIGAQRNDDAGIDSGAAYIYIKMSNTRNGNSWTEYTKLTAPDAQENERFGISVAIDGNTVIIGANGDDDNGENAGAAYIFTFVDEKWEFTEKLTAPDGKGGENYGFSVAIYADQAVVGAVWDAEKRGSVYIYSLINDIWTTEGKFIADGGNADDQFGWSVSMYEDTIAVGAFADDANGLDSGAAYVFQKDSNGVWNQQARVTPNDGEDNDHFGRTVEIHQDWLIVSAPFDDEVGLEAGSVYIYERNADTWFLQAKVLPQVDPTDFSEFGYGVGVSDQFFVISSKHKNETDGGAFGNVYIYNTYVEGKPTVSPTITPYPTTATPTLNPTFTNAPTVSSIPSISGVPTTSSMPSMFNSEAPTNYPTDTPTVAPTNPPVAPTNPPTNIITQYPSVLPSALPTAITATYEPTEVPTFTKLPVPTSTLPSLSPTTSFPTSLEPTETIVNVTTLRPTFSTNGTGTSPPFSAGLSTPSPTPSTSKNSTLNTVPPFSEILPTLFPTSTPDGNSSSGFPPPFNTGTSSPSPNAIIANITIPPASFAPPSLPNTTNIESTMPTV